MDLMKLQNLLNECILIEQRNYLVGNFSVDLAEAQAELDKAKQLMLGGVVGRSEQLLAFKEWERDKCKLPWDAEPKEIVEQYLSQ